MTLRDPAPSPARAALAHRVVSVDIVSDVVCPWCYLGKRRLEAAIRDAGTPVEIHWRPFQLDPTVPPTGLDRTAYMLGKFGDQAKIDAADARLTEAGAVLGLTFAFDRITRAPNTLDAHRLIRWAAAMAQSGGAGQPALAGQPGMPGQQDAVVEALFRAYFTDGRDIGDRKVLVEIAAAEGLDPTLVHRLLASGADEADTREEIASAMRLGVTGVPFFIFAGRYAVPGAQEPRVLAGAIAKARDAEA